MFSELVLQTGGTLEDTALVVLLAVLAVVEGLHHLGVLLGHKLAGHPEMIEIEIKCLSSLRSRPTG